MKLKLIFLLLLISVVAYSQEAKFTYVNGGIVRLDQSQKNIFLTFTGHEYADGGEHILKTLRKNKINASFFFTGDFYRNPNFKSIIKKLILNGNYLGAHSDKHLLYCDWVNRDSTLVTEDSFKVDLMNNYKAMSSFGISINKANFFMPPYEWYNDTISKWSNELGLQIVNFSPGTSSNADYTTPSMGIKYISSDTIYNRILNYEKNNKNGLNGFILLLHIGTLPEREDKMYFKLDALIKELKRRGYKFKTFYDSL